MHPQPKMKAAILREHAGAFELTEVARPAPRPGELLVRIAASGVNPLDLKIRAGQAVHARHALPAVLGIDLAGTVEVVGPGVTGFAIGDEVFGMTGGVGGVPGSLAEFAVVDARLIAPKPTSLTMREAAALPLVFITAWEGLVDRARVREGQNVLVLGGAGGVGHITVQIARAFGARVWATDLAERAELLARLGATAIDRTIPVETYVADHAGGHGFDIVYDTVGGPVLDQAFAAAGRFGHVLSSLGWGTHALAPLSFKGGTYSGVFTLLPLLTGEGREHHGEILREAVRLADAGKVRPVLDSRRFGLHEAHLAHDALDDRSTSGKVVVEVSEAA
jgi:NADPH2:quinone reductase